MLLIHDFSHLRKFALCDFCLIISCIAWLFRSEIKNHHFMMICDYLLPCRFVLLHPCIELLWRPSGHRLHGIASTFLSHHLQVHGRKATSHSVPACQLSEPLDALFLGEFDMHGLASQATSEFRRNLQECAVFTIMRRFSQ